MPATYTLGPPKRPDIKHDNGFLDHFPRRAPTLGDRVNFSLWTVKLEAAEAAQGVPLTPHNDIPDGLAAYRHFLYGHGAQRQFSYERYVINDPSGIVTLSNAILDAQRGAEALYFANYAEKSVSFEMTGTSVTAGRTGDLLYPYPATENWQKAIGAHQFWISAVVKVEHQSSGPHFDMTLKLHVEDMYNFNPNMQDIATGTPDRENGEFELAGLAVQYLNVSSLSRQVTWDGTAPNANVKGQPGGRVRQPSDNRRIRNQL